MAQQNEAAMHDHRNTQSAGNQSFCETTISADPLSSTLPGLRLNVPVPPQLEAAVGYHGEARFFSLYWTPAGDETMVTDGRTTHDGCWWGYQAFVDHPVVMLALAGLRYDLGSSDSEATHWLVIDRETRTTSMAPRAAAEHFLTDQYPALPPIELTREEWDAIVKDVSAHLRTHMAHADWLNVRDQLAAQNTCVDEMTTWLNQYQPDNWQIQIRERLLALDAAE
jgi:hypothetical protein